jgi:membrane protein EpsK
MSRTKNYLSGLVTGHAVILVTTVMGLWLTPFTLRFLSREEYAVFTLAGDMLMWLSLLDIGISSGLNVQAAQLTGKPDAERLNRLASAAFFTQNIVCLVILVAVSLAAFGFPIFFRISPELTQEAVLVTLTLGIGVAINIFAQTFSSLLIANQQIYADNIIRLSLVLFRTGLTVLFLLSGMKMLSLAVANLIAVIITTILALLRVRNLLPSLEIHRKWFSWQVLKSVGSLGIWFSLGGLAGMVITNLDRIITAKIISVELVTTLSLTGRVYILFSGLLHQLTNTARPMLGQLLGSGQIEQAFQRYRQIFVVSTGMTVISAAGLLSMNAGFVTRWVGKENYGGLWLDVALALNMIVHAWVLPNRAILSANMIVRPQTLSRLLEGLLNIMLSIVLAWQIGVVGIVVSTAIAGILSSNWYLPLLTSRMFNRPYKLFLMGDGLRLFIFASVMLILAISARSWFDLDANLVAFLFVPSLVVIIGLIVFWFAILEMELRRTTVVQLQEIVNQLLKSHVFAK